MINSVIGQKQGRVASHFHLQRRTVQVISLLLAVLVPATGLFRLDPRVGTMVILGRQVWFADFFLVMGLWILLASFMVGLYSMAGTVFCGWVCPQNIMAEWANFLTRKLLGKRAEVSLDGTAPIVALSKNKFLNWSILGVILLLSSMALGLVPLFYFYPPQTVLAFTLWQVDPKLAGSLHWIYAMFVLIILIDIAVIRHFWCQFACVYRVWQHTFRTKETLHVRYDASRSADCTKCNYCVTACFIEIDPRKTDVYDSCINCGECIDACHRLHAKKNEPGLLTFEYGQRKIAKEQVITFRNNAASMKSRGIAVWSLALVGATFFGWGLWSWEPYHSAVYRAEVQNGTHNRDYRIEISNKQFQPGTVEIQVQGLKPEDYQLTQPLVTVDGGGRQSVNLELSSKMPHGIHSFIVRTSDTQGKWKNLFAVHYFSD